MKYIKLVLPYVLAGIIIFAGYFSIEGITAVMPSHKDDVRAFDKYENNNLFYMGNNDEITVYPWHVFKESRCSILNSQSEEYETATRNFLDLIIASDHKLFFPDENQTFKPEILFDENLDIVFVKEYAYKNIEGDDYRAMCAFNNDSVVYFHCWEDNQPELTSDEVQSANLRIGEYLLEFHNSEWEYNENISNALYTFYNNYSVPWCYGYPIIVKQKNELLLIYQLNGLQVVLYYNPRLDLITGFSVNWY